jgi:hypothetical protein
VLDFIGTLAYIIDPMKNQYFADRRHLFKYDLLLDVLADVPALDLRLVYVPMLTPDDPRGESPRPSAAGRRRPHLARFLTQGMRNISTLRAFFAVEGVRYYPYRDTEYFDPNQRQEYFDSLPAAQLETGLVFLDPDVGLATGGEEDPRRTESGAHLLHQDLVPLFRRMGASSAVVVSQRLPLDQQQIVDDILARAQVLARWLHCPGIAYVTDDEVVFYGIGHSAGVHQALVRAFERHGNRHSLAAGELSFVEEQREAGTVRGHAGS